MAETDAADILVAKQSATFEFEGRTVVLKTGTAARRGHPILAGREYLFEPLKVTYDLAPQEVELNELRPEAVQLGIDVDGRWGPDRLREEIDKAKAAKAAADAKTKTTTSGSGTSASGGSKSTSSTSTTGGSGKRG